jgi:hypothetical protein
MTACPHDGCLHCDLETTRQTVPGGWDLRYAVAGGRAMAAVGRPDDEVAALLATGPDLPAATARLRAAIAEEVAARTIPAGSTVAPSHPHLDCRPAPCPFHGPSDHPMAGWPLISFDGAIARRCPHALPHPDPDAARLADEAVLPLPPHRCDGCCSADGLLS